MTARSITKMIMVVIALGGLALSTGCSSDSGQTTTPQTAQASSTIRGNVTGLVVAQSSTVNQPSRLAQFKEFLTFVGTAHAQGSDLSGITVLAQQNGVTLDTTTTDAAGNFTLTVTDGSVTLLFTTDDFEVSINIEVPAGSEVTLSVSLQPSEETEPVVVENMDVVQENPEGPIRCNNGTLTLSGDADLHIDGGGDACIRVEGNCTLEANFDAPGSLILSNCEQCIRAEGNALVALTTPGAIVCENATEHGIRASGTAQIDLVAGTTITIAGGGTGVRAEGTALVNLRAEGGLDATTDTSTTNDTTDATSSDAGDTSETGLITITGERAIRVEGNATVNVEAPGDCTIHGTEQNMRIEGNATVNVTCEAPAEAPALTLSPTSVDFGGVPVHAPSDAATVTVTNNRDEALVIGEVGRDPGATDFAIQNDTCSGETLQPDASCTLEVVLTPTHAGAHTATLLVPLDGSDALPFEVGLSGEGVL